METPRSYVPLVRVIWKRCWSSSTPMSTSTPLIRWVYSCQSGLCSWSIGYRAGTRVVVVVVVVTTIANTKYRMIGICIAFRSMQMIRDCFFFGFIRYPVRNRRGCGLIADPRCRGLREWIYLVWISWKSLWELQGVEFLVFYYFQEQFFFNVFIMYCGIFWSSSSSYNEIWIWTSRSEVIAKNPLFEVF